jgi:lycopene beta-cyclase
LPFSARRVLVEDTIYSENALLDHAQCERGILSYAARNGARIARVLRREFGVLPLPIRASASSSPSPPSSRSRAEPLRVGYRGGFFHVVTGYSLPIAVRVALAVARSPTPDDARAAVASVARDLGPQQRFGRLLNRLMFDAMPAASRWTAFERFYRLPDETIARFYASRSTWRDQARVLVGRPPAGLSWSRILGPRSHPSRREPS